MYLEYKKKIGIIRDILEQNIMKRGECPDKAYIESLLNDIDTKKAIFEYEKVKAGENLDTKKLNDDLFCIKKDLETLYQIVSELAGEKYVQLEAYVNGYLSSLEAVADEADKKAREDFEGMSLGSRVVYFKQGMPEATFGNEMVTLMLGNISCTADSKAYGVIEGYGFERENVIFDFGGKKVSPYSVSRETVSTGGETKKSTYTYTLPKNNAYHASFKLANSNIAVDEGYRYEVYGGAGKLSSEAPNKKMLVAFSNGVSYEAEARTHYSFYLVNATKIRFDFSAAPETRSFPEDDVSSMRRDKVYKFDFVMPQDSVFNIETDGIVYATKEEVAINGKELYIVGHTDAEDFLVNVYQPGGPVVFDDVKVYIYGVKRDEFSITSIAVKEYTEETV